MDYIYTFRQAQRDRLEDAGIVQYPRENSFPRIRPIKVGKPHLLALLLVLLPLIIR